MTVQSYQSTKQMVLTIRPWNSARCSIPIVTQYIAHDYNIAVSCGHIIAIFNIPCWFPTNSQWRSQQEVRSDDHGFFFLKDPDGPCLIMATGIAISNLSSVFMLCCALQLHHLVMEFLVPIVAVIGGLPVPAFSRNSKQGNNAQRTTGSCQIFPETYS